MLPRVLRACGAVAPKAAGKSSGGTERCILQKFHFGDATKRGLRQQALRPLLCPVQQRLVIFWHGLHLQVYNKYSNVLARSLGFEHHQVLLAVFSSQGGLELKEGQHVGEVTWLATEMALTSRVNHGVTYEGQRPPSRDWSWRGQLCCILDRIGFLYVSCVFSCMHV